MYVKGWDKYTHHPHHILVGGYTPPVSDDCNKSGILLLTLQDWYLPQRYPLPLEGGNIMATNTQSKIQNSWSLIEFAKKFGPQTFVGKFTNKETGEIFSSLIVGEGDAKCFVSFSTKLGELEPAEIASRKDDLQVVQLESGNYCLCNKGQNAWQAVDLGL